MSSYADRIELSKIIGRRFLHFVGPSVTAKDFRTACNRAVDEVLRALREDTAARTTEPAERPASPRSAP